MKSVVQCQNEGLDKSSKKRTKAPDNTLDPEWMDEKQFQIPKAIGDNEELVMVCTVFDQDLMR